MRQEADLAAALDVGSTGVRALTVGADGLVHAQAYREVLPHCPAEGLVEHDAEALFDAVLGVLGPVLTAARPGQVRGLGLTTQRGTAVVWDAGSGRAVAPALSWQDGRTASS
jgi:glycerol kinase